MAPPHSIPPGRSAFTLMELMVVLALIAILSAAIIPEMRGSFEDAVLRSAARQVVDVCSLANSRAISLSQTHRVRFDRSRNQFVLEAQAGRALRDSPFRLVRDSSAGNRTLDQRVTVEIRPGDAPLTGGDLAIDTLTRSDSVSFYPDGTADSAEVHLSDRSDFSLTLRLNPATARWRILEPAKP